MFNFFKRKKQPEAAVTRTIGQPLYLNLPLNDKRSIERNLQRIKSCRAAVDKTGDKARKQSLSAEVERRRYLLLSVGVAVPDDEAGLDALLRQVREG